MISCVILVSYTQEKNSPLLVQYIIDENCCGRQRCAALFHWWGDWGFNDSEHANLGYFCHFYMNKDLGNYIIYNIVIRFCISEI